MVTQRPCDFRGEDAAGDVHLAEHPAAEDIAVLIGVGRHRQRADGKLAARFVRRRDGADMFGLRHKP